MSVISLLPFSLFSDYKTSSEKFVYLLYKACNAVFELFQKSHLQIYASQYMTS